jgi:purine nucleoside phosphorylase
MKRLGVAWIISVSAVGSLQEKYWPCDIVLVNQFIDRTKRDFEHTLLSNIRGVLLPREWPKPYHPVRAANPDGSISFLLR